MFLSRDSKELLVQRFVKVFDQNPKYMEARNSKTDIPTDFTVHGRTVRCSHVFYKKAVLKNFAISTGNTCVGFYF